MEPSSDFEWPDDPSADWWMVQGTVYGLKPEYIKFAAAKFQLGGHGSRQNSLAASLADIEATPSAAFRIARSVGVQKLLDEAKKIQAGKAPRVTDAEIDQRIDLMIKSPDHRAAGVGIELRAKRDSLARSRDDGPTDLGEITRQLLEVSGPEAAISVFELWHGVCSNLQGCPYLRCWLRSSPTIIRSYGGNDIGVRLPAALRHSRAANTSSGFWPSLTRRGRSRNRVMSSSVQRSARLSLVPVVAAATAHRRRSKLTRWKPMQQPDVSPLAATAQSTADMSPVHPRLGSLVRQFHRAVERQRQRDAEWIATFERAARSPRVRQIVREIMESEHASQDQVQS
jgi:hypothetical protein